MVAVLLMLAIIYLKNGEIGEGREEREILRAFKSLKKNKKVLFTSNTKDLHFSDVFIVTVPTPIDEAKRPDINPLKKACQSIGYIIKERSKAKKSCPVIIFESTVYPGLTEEICVKIIEDFSGLKYNEMSSNGFVCGYSPERINPGDNIHRLTNIKKITSGSNEKVSNWVDELYGSIINAGTFKASSIKEAEAAKIIENTQRDLNIALMNELSTIFNKLKISTKEILEAANTKWNFLNFEPGLVGGHCIGVDPYYLTYKANQIGMKPNLILAGRNVNDKMPQLVVNNFLKLAVKRNLFKFSKKVLLMGITFKENCPDIRNSKSIEVLEMLITYGLDIDIYDPVANCSKISGYKILKELNSDLEHKYAGIFVSVKHEIFKSLRIKFLRKLCVPNSIIFDLKSIYSFKDVDLTL